MSDFFAAGGGSAASDLPPMTREEQLKRARELLNDPLLQQAFLEITESAQATWRATDNPAQREQQWFLIRAVFELQRVLERVLEDERIIGRRERRIRGNG